MPLLAKIAETNEDAVLDALDEATAAALVSEVRGSAAQFTFRHALIRTTLYAESGDIAGAEQSFIEMERLAGELRQPFY
jgi:hypothetical protein